MKLRDFNTTRWGSIIVTFVFSNLVVDLIFSFIAFLVYIEDSSTLYLFILSLLIIISGIIFIILPLLVSVPKFIIDILASIVGIFPVIIGILSLIPSLGLGWTFFTIIQFALGLPLVMFLILNMGNKNKNRNKCHLIAGQRKHYHGGDTPVNSGKHSNKNRKSGH